MYKPEKYPCCHMNLTIYIVGDTRHSEAYKMSSNFFHSFFNNPTDERQTNRQT